MNNFHCPECGFKNFDTDWFYQNDLFGDETECEVECPHCKKKFMARSYHAAIQESCSLEDYERFGEFP